MFPYIIKQIAILAAIYALFLFWGVAFPAQYERVKASKWLTFAHIISIMLALLMPLPAALVPLRDGFIATIHPTLFCLGRNFDVTYYSLVLPLSILLALTSILLVLVFWTVLKVCYNNKVHDTCMHVQYLDFVLTWPSPSPWCCP